MATTATQFLPTEVQNRKDFDVRAGDTVKVNLKIQEKGKTRIQTFQGLVLARKHGTENGGTITVRKVSNGVGVERIFPLYSPNIESIEVVRRAKVRQSKLYFLRDAVAKTMRYKLRRITDLGKSTADLDPVEAMTDGEAQEISAEDMEDEVVEETTEAQAEEVTEESGEEAPAEEVKEEEAPAEEEAKDSEEKEA
jgi:large subunit ribosomal protein L19